MQSPIIFSNEHLEVDIPKDINGIHLQLSLKHTEHLQKVFNDNNISLIDDADDDESKIAALEEHTRHLLIELQDKRNDVSTTKSVKNVENGWAERERNALLKAEAAENRVQCAMAAAYRLAEEREVLNRITAEAKVKCEVLIKENELLSSQVRSMSSEIMALGRRVKEMMAEKASYEVSKQTFHDKMDQVKKTMEETDRWITSTKGTMQRFHGEVDAMKTFKAIIKEDAAKKDAIIQNLKDKLQDATNTIANMAVKIGSMEARK